MKRTIRVMCIALVLPVAFTLIPTGAAQNLRGNSQAAREPHPRNPLNAILKAFDNYRIVALGEVHRNQQVHDLILSLVRHRQFPDKANDIVVEFGNARYQETVDRYVIEEQLLAKNRKALVIFGAQHLIPKPSLVLVKGTWLGAAHMGEPENSPKLEELTDAFLYFGPVRSLRESMPSPGLYRDEVHFRDLVRRDRVQGGFNPAELERIRKSFFPRRRIAKQGRHLRTRQR